jgi:tetratricopeptide (TPR) repeat protein
MICAWVPAAGGEPGALVVLARLIGVAFMSEDGWAERAKQLYERAVFAGDVDAMPAADRELDEVEADLALARGRITHARFLAERQEDPRELDLFERAAELYERLGDRRGEAEALFWVGIFHQVVHDDSAAALPYLERSYELAVETDDKLTQSYAVRHLGFADLAGGNVETARERLEESVRLRREIGFAPGVAAGLLALAELAGEEGDMQRAEALLDEAHEIAVKSDSRGVLGWIEHVRAGHSTA